MLNLCEQCFRLLTEESFEKLEPSPIPEIQRCNLANMVLQVGVLNFIHNPLNHFPLFLPPIFALFCFKLKAIGIPNILAIDFMDRPSTNALQKALEFLYELSVFNDEVLCEKFVQ